MADQLVDDFKNAIPPLLAALEKLQLQEMEIKKTINSLSVLAGENPPFADINTANLTGALNISRDQFFGKPFASAVKAFLKMKGNAATSEEILDALTKGGFEFDEDWEAKRYLNNIAISMSKNTNDFVSVSNGNYKAFGLWDFYPEKKRKKEKAQKDKANRENVENSTADTKS